jgi:hypothetical protein
MDMDMDTHKDTDMDMDGKERFFISDIRLLRYRNNRPSVQGNILDIELKQTTLGVLYRRHNFQCHAHLMDL